MKIKPHHIFARALMGRRVTLRLKGRIRISFIRAWPLYYIFFPGRAGAAAVARGASWGGVGLGAAAGAEFTLIQKAGELGVYNVTGYLPNGQTSPMAPQYVINTAVELATSTVLGAGLGFIGSQMMGKFPALSYKLKWTVPTKANPLAIKYDPVSVSEVNKAFLGTAANPSGTIAGSNAGRTLTARNEQKVELPNRESMKTEDAFAWLKTQSNRINELIEGIEGAQNRAIAASYWVNEFKIAMRNAMAVQEDAMLLSRIDPIQNFNTELQNIGNSMGGDAKFKALVGKSKTAWQRTQDDFNTEKARIAKALEDSCFAAGTLVHTINGLVPIEEIKTGDLVLSKPEYGGEKSYKPVTKTFVHDFQNVNYVSISRDRDFEGNRIQNITDADYCHFLVTGNHPFYKNGEFASDQGGWEEIQNIGVGAYVELLDGDGSTTVCNPVFHSSDPGVAFVPNHYHRWDEGGRYFDYLPAPDLNTWRGADVVPRVFDRYEIPMTVYNFEVQDNHTYYVGTIGVWVHNKRVKVLSEQQLNALTGKDAGQLHMAKESFPRTGIPTDSQAYALKTRGAEKIEGGTAAPVIEFDSPLEGKANSVSLDYVVRRYCQLAEPGRKLIMIWVSPNHHAV